MDRVATFQTFIARSPNDPFPRYGLAMELKSRGDLAGAKATFDELLTRFPDYVPTYLMAGGTMAALGDKPAAAAIYEAGVAAATRKGDSHARGELQAALVEIAEQISG
jgi:predicted Zn-dependent protease